MKEGALQTSCEAAGKAHSQNAWLAEQESGNTIARNVATH